MDSNIYYSFSEFKGVMDDVLNYIRGTHSTLILPQVVIDESSNNLRERYEKAIANYSVALDNLKELGIDVPSPELPDLTTKAINYENKMKLPIDGLKVDIVDYSADHLRLVSKRAISKRKPFKMDGEGFRDALIWESFLSTIRKNSKERFIFISGNIKDFGNKEGSNFHESLAEELCVNFPGTEVIYLRSLGNFIKRFGRKIESSGYQEILESEEFKSSALDLIVKRAITKNKRNIAKMPDEITSIKVSENYIVEWEVELLAAYSVGDNKQYLTVSVLNRFAIEIEGLAHEAYGYMEDVKNIYAVESKSEVGINLLEERFDSLHLDNGAILRWKLLESHSEA